MTNTRSLNTKRTGTILAKKVNKATSPIAKKDQSMFLRIEPSIRDNGRTMLGTAMESRYGQMEPSMRGTGRIIKLTVKVSFGTSTVTNMKANGSETKLMDSVNILIVMELPIKVTGKTIFNMEMV